MLTFIRWHEKREQGCFLFLFLPHDVEGAIFPRALAKFYWPTANIPAWEQKLFLQLLTYSFNIFHFNRCRNTRM